MGLLISEPKESVYVPKAPIIEEKISEALKTYTPPPPSILPPPPPPSLLIDDIYFSTPISKTVYSSVEEEAEQKLVLLETTPYIKEQILMHPEVFEAETMEEGLAMVQEIIIEEKKQYLETRIIKDKAFYKGFSLRELAYIYNSGEITHGYSHSIIQSATVNPFAYSGRIYKFEDYQRRPTSFTSDQILSVISDYSGITMDKFAEMVVNENFGNDKARYIMSKLGIYDYSLWHEKTGFVSKGKRFIPQVSKNIGAVLGGVSKFVGNVVGDVVGSMFEGVLGTDWKKKLGIGIIIVVVVVIIGIIGLYYGKSYIGAKAVKKAVG